MDTANRRFGHLKWIFNRPYSNEMRQGLQVPGWMPDPAKLFDYRIKLRKLWGKSPGRRGCRYAHLVPDHQLAAVERLCETDAARSITTDARTSTDAKTAVEAVALQ